MYAVKELVENPISKEEFLDLPYRDLQSFTGIDIARWSLWFNMKVAPSFGTLEDIAKDLKMPILELVEAFLERRSRTIQSKERKSA